MHGEERTRKNKFLYEGPFNVNFTLCLGGDLLESPHGQVNGVGVVAGGAVISNCNGDGLPVALVGNVNLLATKWGCL
jgi:hypothetical protein